MRSSTPSRTAGADAVKFQTHIAAAESSPDEPWRVKFSPQDDSRFDYWKRMEFTAASVAGSQGARGRAWPLFPELSFLRGGGGPAGRGRRGGVEDRLRADHRPVDARAARQDRSWPVLILDGHEPARRGGVGRPMGAVDKGLEVAVMQCTSAYPSAPEGRRLERDDRLSRRAREWPWGSRTTVGRSSHRWPPRLWARTCSKCT